MGSLHDYSGYKFGHWIVLERYTRTTKCGFVIWIVQCECGKKGFLNSGQISSKRYRKHCGCKSDWTGKKFGRLTVVKKISGKGNHAAKILCKCDCGNEKIVWGGSLHQGTTKSCGCIKSRTEEFRCVTIVLGGYIRHAKRRSLEFNLSRDQFLKIVLEKCLYCGEIFSKITKRKTKFQGELSFKHNGVDRIDNSKGYILNNCVPCCKLCNRMKGTLSYTEWIAHIGKISKNEILQSTPLGG